MLARREADIRLHPVRRRNRPGSWIVATNRTAVTGPIPGAVISGRHTTYSPASVRSCLLAPRPRSGGRQPPLLVVEQGQPLAAAPAIQSERGRSQGAKRRGTREALLLRPSVGYRLKRPCSGWRVRASVATTSVLSGPLPDALSFRRPLGLDPADPLPRLREHLGLGAELGCIASRIATASGIGPSGRKKGSGHVVRRQRPASSAPTPLTPGPWGTRSTSLRHLRGAP